MNFMVLQYAEKAHFADEAAILNSVVVKKMLWDAKSGINIKFS